jgi:diacylglycerol kinase (ATP)
VTRTIAVAISPTAGGGRCARLADPLAALWAAHGIRVLPVTGGDAEQTEHAARDVVAAGVEALVVVGGDGMTQLGLNAVAGTPTPLGIVAAGTGNDIARGLGLTVGDPRRAAGELLGALEQGAVRSVDAVRWAYSVAGPVAGPLAGRWFAGVLGAGFDALVNERANGWRRPRGHLRYDLAILRELPMLRARDYHLVLDGEPWHTPAVMVVVANGTSYGGGMRVCPGALMDDGLLDVLVVAPLSRTAFLRLYPRVYAGTHVDDPRVLVRRARRVTVAAAGIVAYADGERLGPLPVTCEAVPGALRVLVPRGPVAQSAAQSGGDR